MSESDSPAQGDAPPIESAPPPAPAASEAAPPNPPITEVTGATPVLQEQSLAPVQPPTVLESLACPSCDSVLRNVSVQPGATVRCLNCGKKFIPPGMAIESAPAVNSSGANAGKPLALLGKEPRAAGYWLLRIPAILYFAGTLFGFAIMVFNAGNILPFGGFQNLIWFSYWPLIPAAGTIGFLATRAMARIDGSSVFLAWRNGVIGDSLPPVTGSSLPYIGPLAITGGALPVFCIVAFQNDQGAAVVGAIYGALFFYAGFALEDIRQFIWRQHVLAQKCCERIGIETKQVNDDEIAGMTGWLFGGVMVCASIVTLSIMFQSYRWRSWNSEDILPIFLAIGGAVVSISFIILGRAWDKAVGWWQLAARVAKKTSMDGQPVRHVQINSFIWENESLPGALRRMVLAPIIWLGGGAFWMFLMLMTGKIRFSNWESITILFLCIGGACLAAFLARFLAQLVRWRQAQSRIWIHLQGGVERSRRPANSLYGSLVWSLILLGCIECGLFSIFIFDNVFRYSRNIDLEAIGLPLLVFMMHYPTLWFAVVLGQTLSLETFLASRQNVGSNDGTVEIENTELA